MNRSKKNKIEIMLRNQPTRPEPIGQTIAGGFFLVLMIMTIIIIFSSCSTSPERTEFTVSTCPPYCDNDSNDYSHCDEVSEDEDGNKICTTYGRW